jgi:peptidylprolyl isomerase
MSVALLTAALAIASLAPTSSSAQTSTQTQTKAKPATASAAKPVHKPTASAAASAAPKLPANIPVVKGIPKTLVKIELKYIDAKLGTGELAQPGWKYSVHYTGWLHDGTKFDSSVDRGTPIDFIQGAHRVIPGWDQGFAGMRVGGKRRLFIPYQLAYGEGGRGPIPPKADLIFDIELVAQSDPNAPPPTPATPPAPPAPPAPAQPATPPPAAQPATPPAPKSPNR